MDYRLLLLDFDGRIGRKWYWLGTLIIFASSFAVNFLAGFLYQLQLGSATFAENGVLVTRSIAVASPFNPVNLASWAVRIAGNVGLVYAGFALQAKRWHDRGKSGWWSLIGFVPLIGTIWVLVECGCLRGDAGLNRYGSDPLDDPVAALDGNPAVAL